MKSKRTAHSSRKRLHSSKKAMHVVFRSRYFALRNARHLKLVGDLIFQYAAKFNIKVYQNSVNSNHIHLIVLAKNQSAFQSFLRVLPGQIAQRITGSVRGRALKQSFWLKIAWSRLIEWGRAFRIAMDYVFTNQREAVGISRHSERGTRYGPKT